MKAAAARHAPAVSQSLHLRGATRPDRRRSAALDHAARRPRARARRRRDVGTRRKKLQDGAAPWRRRAGDRRYAWFAPRRHSTPAVAVFVDPGKTIAVDVDRMLVTVGHPDQAPRRPAALFRCVLTQTTRNSISSKHIRSELAKPACRSRTAGRTGSLSEAALWGATPSLISWKGTAAREIAAMADEVDMVLGAQQAAA